MAEKESKATVVAGTGTAAGSSAVGEGVNHVQDAMTAAIHSIARETEALAAHPTMSQAEKTEKIAALNHSDTIKGRMMQARAKVLADAADREQEASRGLKPTTS